MALDSGVRVMRRSRLRTVKAMLAFGALQRAVMRGRTIAMRQYGQYVKACCDVGNGESAIAKMREGKSVVCLVLGQVASRNRSGSCESGCAVVGDVVRVLLWSLEICEPVAFRFDLSQ